MDFTYEGPEKLRIFVSEVMGRIEGSHYRRFNPRVVVGSPYLSSSGLFNQHHFGYGSRDEFNRYVDTHIELMDNALREYEDGKTPAQRRRAERMLNQYLKMIWKVRLSNNPIRRKNRQWVYGCYVPGEDSILIDAFSFAHMMLSIKFLGGESDKQFKHEDILRHELVHHSLGESRFVRGFAQNYDAQAYAEWWVSKRDSLQTCQEPSKRKKFREAQSIGRHYTKQGENLGLILGEEALAFNFSSSKQVYCGLTKENPRHKEFQRLFVRVGDDIRQSGHRKTLEKMLNAQNTSFSEGKHILDVY
ncbi:hypothetical protein HYU13_04070 [Candidatus Woesearchaeota archaeon]|nr:hypothetical protein [Candidatus Woesearchaeota archaeon]